MSQTTDNSGAFDLDIATLDRYLCTHVEGFRGLVRAEKFPGGQSNPTYLLQADSGQYVLRRQPPGQLLRSAHAVDREYRVLKALADTDVPVAKAYHLCEDRDIIGSMFYVMSYEQGDIFWNPALPDVQPQNRASYFKELIRILAAIHSVDVQQRGLGDFGRPGNYFERQLTRWEQQYRAAETETKPDMEALIAWLTAACPEDDGQVALVHGDFRIDNIIFQSGQPQGIAVLDWELSTLGHPLADLAYFCMCLRLPPGPYNSGLGGVDRIAQALPCEADIVRDYCERRGLGSIEHWNFYLGFSFFRLASIIQGVYKRALTGNASNSNALAMGALVDVLASMALELSEQ